MNQFVKSGSQARRGAGALRVVLLGAAIATAAALAIPAWAHAPGANPGDGMGGPGMHGHAMHGQGMGMHGQGMGMHGQGMGMHGQRMGGAGMHGGMMFGGSPERMGRRIDMMLDGLNASDEQRSKIKQIAQGATADMRAQHEAARGLRDKAMQVFAAPTVDAAAAEALRQQMLAMHDQRSKRMTQAMLEMSQVLTPEQRGKLGQRIEQRNAQRQERTQRMERWRQQPQGTSPGTPQR